MDGKSVLVVDDSKSARFAMRRFLERFGCRVETADGGEAALTALRSRRPDFVFLDHLMPVMDGLAVLDRLRQDPATATLPVVLCSSDDGPEFLQQARLHGAVAVMVKPPTARQMKILLEQLRQLPHSIAASPAAAAPAGSVPSVTGRVQIIRDPEVMIEQAVMKALREALPGGAAAVRPATLTPPMRDPIRLSFDPSTAPVATPAERPSSELRTEIEARLQHMTQDLFAQLGEVRAQLARLDAAVASAQQSDDERIESIQAVISARLDRMDLQFDEQLSVLREELLARIEGSAREARAAAIDEAHAVSERVVMNAAKRISDQIAESILNVLKPQVLHQTG
jgi:CheY-like chemotaxis protein